MAESNDAPQSGKKEKNRIGQQQRKRRQRIILCLAVFTTLCTVVLAFKVVPHLSDIIALRREQAALPELSPFDAEYLEINPDYVGWLKIDGTIVDYPVARASDNTKYLNTTFRGNENMLGSIFMDYRCNGEDLPHIIIYGHDADDVNKNKLMFGGLKDFMTGLIAQIICSVIYVNCIN